MADRPAIPYESRPYDWEDQRAALRWTRKLAEAGKLSGRPVKRIPRFIPNLVIVKPEPPEDAA